MHWYRILPVLAVAAGRLTAADDSARALMVAVSRPPVLRSEEPRESVLVRLPGTSARPPKVAVPPATPVAAAPAPITPAPAVASKPSIPPPITSDPLLPFSVPSPAPTLSATALIPPPVLAPRQPKLPAKPFLPADFERDSALFTQRRIAEWSQPDAYNLFGNPLRERPAFNDDHSENGRIYAYADPTGRYRELELDFAADTGMLRTVFVYPWKMTWQECRRLWGANVDSTAAAKGRMFYSYLNRRLDVLVDPSGRVISLGLY
jgi:hypothetical protein